MNSFRTSLRMSRTSQTCNADTLSEPMNPFILSGRLRVASALAALLLASTAVATETVWLDTLDLTTMQQGRGRPQVNRSMTEKPLSLGGKAFERGVGTHANSAYRLTLAGGTDRFVAT